MLPPWNGHLPLRSNRPMTCPDAAAEMGTVRCGPMLKALFLRRPHCYGHQIIIPSDIDTRVKIFHHNERIAGGVVMSMPL